VQVETWLLLCRKGEVMADTPKIDNVRAKTSPLFDQQAYLLSWLYGQKRTDKIGLLIAMRRNGGELNTNKSFVIPVPVQILNVSQDIRVQLHLLRRGMGIGYNGMNPIQISFACRQPMYQNMNALYSFYEALEEVFGDEGQGYVNYLFALNLDHITMAGYITNYSISADDPNVFNLNINMIISSFMVRGASYTPQQTQSDGGKAGEVSAGSKTTVTATVINHKIKTYLSTETEQVHSADNPVNVNKADVTSEVPVPVGRPN